MPKRRNIPVGWKRFKLANGERKWLPPWANEPLKFNFSPDAALARGSMVKVSKTGKNG